MRVTIRLYKTQDLDLLMLTRDKKFKIQQAMYYAVCGYVRKKAFRIKIPGMFLSGKIPSIHECPNRVQFHIELNDEKDKDVIRWLLQCKNGYRNSMIKNITRNFLEMPLFALYFEDKDCIEKELKKTSLFFERNAQCEIEEFGKTGMKSKKTKLVTGNKENRNITKEDAPKKDTDTLKEPNTKKESSSVLVKRIEDARNHVEANNTDENEEEYNSFFDDIEAMMRSL